ncbi:hypothetical protein CTI12_AA275380 [Artemisia annua]|uniref:Uncharacterized protein n=1 Tax=Artemisia annua TaxID=35608 RepID=A0A2U1NF18_ARTAN|nr:hypothetical protein CTI12_AA275380 [Artemisia annua]
MKVHPSPFKPKITIRYNYTPQPTTPSSRQKKLQRLPHIFTKVLELPFYADTEVTVVETSESLKFVVDTDIAGEMTVPEMATARLSDGELVVVVPKTINQEIKRMFLNKREHYAYNHIDETTFAYNNLEEEADDSFGYNLHDLMNDPKMLSRYMDLADFNFFNCFHDEFDDQDFL